MTSSNHLLEAPVAPVGDTTRLERLVVPVDGSADSWRAVDVAVALGRRCGASVDILGVAISAIEANLIRDELAEALADRGTDPDGPAVGVVVRVRGFVAAEIADYANARPDALVVMTSHGRGRSAVFGGVASDTVVRMSGPVLMVGPHVTETDRANELLDGPVLVTVDGSVESESALPLAASWAGRLGSKLWIVEVNDADPAAWSDITETGHSAHLAHRLAADTGIDVQFEALHGRNVAAAVARYADDLDASMVVAATHGRSGLARLVVGSTAAGFVRQCHCPVLLQRPPQFAVWPASLP